FSTHFSRLRRKALMLDQQVARTFPTGPYVVTDRFEDLPKRHYGLIYADPAWRFQTWGNATEVTARGREVHYRTQTLEEIEAIPVGSIAGDDCVLILWILGCLLPESLELITEFCWLGRRGKPKRLSLGVRELIIAPRREHSRKPHQVYARVE